jgi:hypothetical protein
VLEQMDRGGHPTINPFLNPDGDKNLYNSRQPANDVANYLGPGPRCWKSLGVALVWIQAQVPLDRTRLTNSATRRCNPADWLADQGTGQGIPGCDQPALGATVDATDTAEEMTHDYLSHLIPAVRYARSLISARPDWLPWARFQT